MNAGNLKSDANALLPRPRAAGENAGAVSFQRARARWHPMRHRAQQAAGARCAVAHAAPLGAPASA